MTLQKVNFFQYPIVDGYQTSGIYFGTPGGTDSYTDGYTVTTSVTTIPIYLGNARGYTMVFDCPATGSPNGSLKLQGCCDESRAFDGRPDNALQNWFDIPYTVTSGTTSTTSVSQSISGSTTIVLSDFNCYYRWIRGVITVGSGSMIVTMKIQWKGWV